MTKILTHNGKFHADDVFACAVIWLLTGDKPEVIRSRDMNQMDKVDFVLDVGLELDPNKKHFDHHQIGFNEKREVGLPYATFGLVWREYGEKICDNKKIADRIDEKLVKYVDATDNGVCVYEKITESDVHCIYDVINCFNPTWQEKKNNDLNFADGMFVRAMELAREILTREITQERDVILAESKVLSAYNESKDKKLVVLDDHYPWAEILEKYPEPLFVVSPNQEGDAWVLLTVKKKPDSFENKKDLPKEWTGKNASELSELVGVSDAIFCHNARFIATAKSKESILKMAEIALGSEE